MRCTFREIPDGPHSSQKHSEIRESSHEAGGTGERELEEETRAHSFGWSDGTCSWSIHRDHLIYDTSMPLLQYLTCRDRVQAT